MACGVRQLHLNRAVILEKETTGWPWVPTERRPGPELWLRSHSSQDRACLFGAESPAVGGGTEQVGAGEPFSSSPGPGGGSLSLHTWASLETRSPNGMATALQPHTPQPLGQALLFSGPQFTQVVPKTPGALHPGTEEGLAPPRPATGHWSFSPGKEPRLNLRPGPCTAGRGQEAPTPAP